MERVRQEKGVERGLSRYSAAQRVHAAVRPVRTSGSRRCAQRRPPRRHIEDSRSRACAARTTSSQHPRRDFGRRRQSVEIRHDARETHARFARAWLDAFNPPPFSVLNAKEIERLERAYNAFQHVMEHGQQSQVRADEAVFETIASRVKHVHVIANRDVGLAEAVMPPLNPGPRAPSAAAPAAGQHQRIRRKRRSWKSASSELEQPERAIRLQRGCSTQTAAIDAIVDALMRCRWRQCHAKWRQSAYAACRTNYFSSTNRLICRGVARFRIWP
jgi:hypothetical protein